MAIRITEILGTDNMNNSRITINNNFKTIAETINRLDNQIHTEIAMGSISAENLTLSNGLKIGNTELTEDQLQQLLTLIQ